MTTLCKSAVMNFHGCYPSRIVLRYGHNELHPYVVHTEVFPTEEGREPYFIHGDYCETLEEAVQVFGTRAKRELVRAELAKTALRQAGGSRIVEVAS